MSIVPQEQVAAMQQQGDFAIKSSDVAAKLGESGPPQATTFSSSKLPFD
jgi:hypothetical protein